MTSRQRVITAAFAGLTCLVAALAGAAPGSADPVDPTVTPVPAPPPDSAPIPAPAPPAGNLAAMTPRQAPVPAADPAAAVPPGAVPPAPITPQHPPEVANQVYGSGNYGGGMLGTLRDLWHQAQNPDLSQDVMMGGAGARPVPPAGAGPAPALPPGFVSTNAPGSETASTAPAGGSGPRPALPPGYYSVNGPPPPGYEFGSNPLAPATPAAPAAPTAPPVIILSQ